MAVTCRNCGQEWERDPAVEVACPTCTAEVGQNCQRPSGHPCRIHAERDRRALEEVCDYSVCPASDAPGRPVWSAAGEQTHNGETRQATLFLIAIDRSSLTMARMPVRMLVRTSDPLSTVTGPESESDTDPPLVVDRFHAGDDYNDVIFGTARAGKSYTRKMQHFKDMRESESGEEEQMALVIGNSAGGKSFNEK